jgi:hypothetical protein
MDLGQLVSSRFHDHTDRHITLGRTPLDEGPARRRDFYLTTHNTHKRQTSMTPVEFEPTILVSERPKTHALDRAATRIGIEPTILVSERPKTHALDRTATGIGTTLNYHIICFRRKQQVFCSTTSLHAT